MSRYSPSRKHQLPGWLKWSHLVTLLAALVVVGGCADTSPPSPRQQAAVFFKNGDWQNVVRTTTPLLEQSPADAQLLTWRGQSNVALSLYDDAISDFTRLIQVTPEDPEAYYLRQMAFERYGKTELAEADGNQARRLDPKYKTAYAFEASNFTEGLDPSLLSRKPMDSDEEMMDGEGDLAQSDAEDATTDAWGRTKTGANDEEGSQFATDSAAEKNSPAMSISDSYANSRNEATANLGDWRQNGGTGEPAGVAPGNSGDSFGAGMSAVNPHREGIVERTPDSPRGPEAPGAEFQNNLESFTGNNSRPATGGSSAIDDWVSKHGQTPMEQRLAELKRERPKREPENRNFNQPAPAPVYVPPAISTSLPPGVAGLGVTPGPISFGPASNPSAIPGPAAGFQAGARPTGISSRPTNGFIGVPGIVSSSPFTGATGLSSSLPGNLQVGQPQPAGIRPGQFQGNTLYAPGQRPVLSTSMPTTTGASANTGLISGGVANPLSGGLSTPVIQPGRVLPPRPVVAPQSSASLAPPVFVVPQ